MQEGLYESLVTGALALDLQQLEGLTAEIEQVDAGDQPHVLAHHVQAAVHRALAATADPQRRMDLVNALLDHVAAAGDTVTEGPNQLLSVVRQPAPGVITIATTRPSTPLSDAALLTNAHGEPSLGAEVKAELPSANEVDLLCAFVKWTGLRVLAPELHQLKERKVPLRVITTTYIGATDRAALDRLVREFGAEVKIQYDATRTRLHAKAWLFRRRTLFDTAYVGSSNLSTAALLDGVEWNVRLSRIATPTLLEKFQATFDTYWNDATFESYNPEHVAERDRLDDALSEASGARSSDRVTISLSGLEVRPYPYQERMLEEIQAERLVHHRHHNLVVAATGTGKTVVAALDCRRLCNGNSSERPSLLFVAHARRSSSSRSAPIGRSSPTGRSASCTSTGRAPSDGGMSSPRSSP